MAIAAFRGVIPGDRRYDTRHDMWVRREGATVLLGATAFGIFLAGPLIAFTAKPRGAAVMIGRGLGTVESSKTVIAVHAPLSVVLEDCNEEAERHPRLVNDDPYGAGWMARGRPLAWAEECLNLVDAAAYAAHVRAMDPGAIVEVTA
ncbi:MAG: hypothetical protein PHY45_14090 [Rhodocyclaceae bacterium]|nr:hypothetical protein [Rhodocyclaceae bacterium]